MGRGLSAALPPWPRPHSSKSPDEPEMRGRGTDLQRWTWPHDSQRPSGSPEPASPHCPGRLCTLLSSRNFTPQKWQVAPTTTTGGDGVGAAVPLPVITPQLEDRGPEIGEQPRKIPTTACGEPSVDQGSPTPLTPSRSYCRDGEAETRASLLPDA